MANVKIYKCLPHILRSCRFRDKQILSFYHQKAGKCHREQFSQMYHSMANVKYIQMSPTTFLFQLLLFQRYKFFTLIIGQGQGVKFSQLYHSMASVKIYKCLPQIFLRQLLPFQRYNNFKLLTSKKQVKIMEYNSHNCTIRWQMSKYTIVSHTLFALALNV